jgi:hypothetical protein
MTYHLVIQFAAENPEDFDRLIKLEEMMRTRLEISSNILVDGHDFGMGEFNVFLHTNEPDSTLEKVGELIDTSRPGLPFSAGYRDFKEDEYIALWPSNLEHFRVA